MKLKIPHTIVGLVFLLAISIAPAAADPLTITAVGTTVVNVTPSEEVLENDTSLTIPSTLNLAGVTSQIAFDVAAPAGFEYNITPVNPSTEFTINVGYQINIAGSGITLTGTPTFSFTGLQGIDPSALEVNVLAGSILGNTYVSFQIAGPVSSSFSFTGLQVDAPISGTGNSLVLDSSTSRIQIVDNNFHEGQATDVINVDPVTNGDAVPEPSTWALLSFALITLGLFNYRRLKSAA